MTDIRHNVILKEFTFTGTDRRTGKRKHITIDAESAGAAMLALASVYADLQQADEDVPGDDPRNDIGLL